MLVSLSIPVSISLSTLIVELLIFLGTVWFMELLVFRPIRIAWAERDRRIEEGLNASNQSREEVQEARAEVQRLLTEARHEAQQQIDSAVAAGARVRDELVAQATEEFRRQLEAARGQILQDREQTAASLQARIVDIALLAAARVTGQSFDQPQVRNLAASVVSQEGLQ
jgi:F-type H+-transporting ATPase subunit b